MNNDSTNTTAYNVKLIRSKYKKEVWLYDEPIGRNYTQNTNTERRKFTDLSPNEKIKSLKKRVKNAKNQRWNIIRLVEANSTGITYKNGKKFTDKFLTLTFKTPLKISDIKKANHFFWLFINRLRRYLNNHFNSDLRYLAAWEIQPHSKRIHYHIILFQFPFISITKLSEIWKNGYIWIEKIDNIGPTYVGAYIAKYLTKNIETFNPALFKVKKFFKSQNIIQPDTRHYLISPDTFDEKQNGLKYQSVYTQKRYDALTGNFYSTKVHYYLYQDEQNQKA